MDANPDRKPRVDRRRLSTLNNFLAIAAVKPSPNVMSSILFSLSLRLRGTSCSLGSGWPPFTITNQEKEKSQFKPFFSYCVFNSSEEGRLFKISLVRCKILHTSALISSSTTIVWWTGMMTTTAQNKWLNDIFHA